MDVKAKNGFNQSETVLVFPYKRYRLDCVARVDTPLAIATVGGIRVAGRAGLRGDERSGFFLDCG